MAGRIAYYGNIVLNGLVVNLDAGKRDSYPGSGTTWTDIIKRGNNGTLTNGPTFDSNNAGSIVFDGADDYVSLPSTSLGVNWTISVWFNRRNQASPETLVNIVSTGYGDEGWYSNTMWEGGRQIWWYFGPGWSTSASNVWNYETWHNIVTIVNGRQHLCYIDGTQIISQNSSYDPSAVTLGWIGRMTGANRIFPGKIGQYLVYNRALSVSEITQNYNATKGRYGL